MLITPHPERGAAVSPRVITPHLDRLLNLTIKHEDGFHKQELTLLGLVRRIEQLETKQAVEHKAMKPLIVSCSLAVTRPCVWTDVCGQLLVGLDFLLDTALCLEAESDGFH